MSAKDWAARRGGGQGWSEDAHPRDEKGRFSGGGGAGQWAGRKLNLSIRGMFTSAADRKAEDVAHEREWRAEADAAKEKLLGKAAPLSQLVKRVESHDASHEERSGELPAHIRQAIASSLQASRADIFLKKSPVSFDHETAGKGEETHASRSGDDNPCYMPSVQTVYTHDTCPIVTPESVGMNPKSHAGKMGPDAEIVARAGATAHDMRAATFTHELSHHMHLGAGGLKDKGFDREIHDAFHDRVDQDDREGADGGYGAIKPGKWVPSAYAKTNHAEWFAETHAAYVHNNAELKKKDPEAHALVGKWREALGMPRIGDK